MHNGTTPDRIPTCPTDGLRMMATIAGWRCAICGLAALPVRARTLDEVKRAHPAFR